MANISPIGTTGVVGSVKLNIAGLVQGNVYNVAPPEASYEFILASNPGKLAPVTGDTSFYFPYVVPGWPIVAAPMQWTPIGSKPAYGTGLSLTISGTTVSITHANSVSSLTGIAIGAFHAEASPDQPLPSYGNNQRVRYLPVDALGANIIALPVNPYALTGVTSTLLPALNAFYNAANTYAGITGAATSANMTALQQIELMYVPSGTTVTSGVAPTTSAWVLESASTVTVGTSIVQRVLAYSPAGNGNKAIVYNPTLGQYQYTDMPMVLVAV